MELWSALKEDHRNITAILDEMKGRRELRESLVGDLRDAIDAHVRGEEQAVYPALRVIPGYGELIARAVEQHAAMRNLAGRLASAGADEWDAIVAELATVAVAYIEEEEDKIIDAGRHELPAHAVEHIKHEFIAARKAALEQRHEHPVSG